MTHKGTPQSLRSPYWHKRHMAKMKRRAHIRLVHIQESRGQRSFTLSKAERQYKKAQKREGEVYKIPLWYRLTSKYRVLFYLHKWYRLYIYAPIKNLATKLLLNHGKIETN